MAIYPYSFTLPPVNKQDIPSNGVPGEFLGISAGGVLDWLPVSGGSGTGDLLAANNLSELTPTAGTARTNLGLGTGDSPTFANLTLTSPSLSSSAPVTISQTWDDLPTAFTALKVNATSTNSAASSKLLDLQVGGVSKFYVNKGGDINTVTGINCVSISGTTGFFGGSIRLNNNAAFLSFGAPSSVFLQRDDADNTLALRNGANTQTFNVYGSYGSISDYKRLSISCDQTTGATKISSNRGSETTGNGSITLEVINPAGIYNRLNLSFDRPFFSNNAGIVNLPSSNNYTISSRALIPANQVGMGFQVFETLTTGVHNVGFGLRALAGSTTANYCIGLGFEAGYKIANDSLNNVCNDSIFIGRDTRALNSSETNQIVIGHTAVGIGSHSVVLGNDSIEKTALKGNVGIGTTAPTARLEVAFPTSLTGLNLVSAGSTSVSNFVTWSTPYGSLSGGIKSGAENGWTTQIYSNQQLSLSAGGVDSSDLLISAAGNVGIGTTLPTSKLHVVGDAVLTGDLLGTNYTIGVPTILTQSNISITNTHSGVSDSAIVITPKGVGAFIVGPKPDGTVTGGNARGNYAVDLQAKRGINTQVASGINSFIAGGIDNTASGNYSFVAGNGNIASGNFSSINGGIGNTASSLNSLVCGGESNIASGGRSNISGGLSNSTTALLGFIAGGQNGLADRYSLNAHAAGQFSTRGDAQKTTAVFRNKTTTNSPVELFLDGSSARYTVTSGKIISMLINITGTKSDGSAVAHYVRQYSIKNIGGTTSEVYAAVTVGTDNAAGTSIALSANGTNDALKIEVTGVASETWRWVASVDAVEVGHGV